MPSTGICWFDLSVESIGWRQDGRMLHLRISAPSALRDDVVRLLEADLAISSLAVLRGASLRPIGDLIFADVAREGANEIVDQLRAIGVQREGTVHIDPVNSWL